MPFDINEFDKQNPGIFTGLDLNFSSFMQELNGKQSGELVLAARLASHLTGKGNICVNISEIADKDIFSVIGSEGRAAGEFISYGKDEWLTALKKSHVVGTPGEFKPLIIDDAGRLYLYRYWKYERQLAENIKARLGYRNDADADLLIEGLNRLFGPGNAEQTADDMGQATASIAAVLNNFCVISGGPGTGKTSTIIKILALLLEQAEAKGLVLKIALAAPTGKAAARLRESVRNSKTSLECSGKIKQMIPEESFTIHRLLGPVYGSPYFKYNSENQLPYDIVIIDESSMADLALTAKLFEAIPASSRLILLGDKDQLSSVEAGAVLGDICDTGSNHSYSGKFTAELKKIFPGQAFAHDNIAPKKDAPIADSIMILSRSYRFGTESGIGEISRLVKQGNAESAVKALKQGKFSDISLIEKIYDNNYNILSGRIIEGFSPYIKADNIEKALRLLSNFTILCALRKGPSGSEAVNSVTEDILSKAGYISKENCWYAGRPVLINRNDYDTGLFNGDTGIIMNDPADGKADFFSFSSDGAVRKIMPLKLPDHETSFAITVHKSQGSEFENVLLLLPEKISPVLTRELLYTAITRAKKKVEIIGSENILRHMINNPTSRKSGLRDALWSVEENGV